MDTIDASRRAALATLGSTALLGLAPLTLGGCESLLEQIRNRPRRRDLATLAANDPIIQGYRDAVAQMKALPSTDPRNWNRQAQIHFDFCPHGNWFFLPWHRAYLLYFEQICRTLIGDKNFALPYWNWTCHRTLPTPFLGSASDPLFSPGRTGVPPAALGDGSVGTTVMDAILDEANFLLFASDASSGLRPPVGYGPLEGNPHNTVHGFVGGIMGSFHSPRDPVFWMHHNMIERVWWEWNVVRGHANTNDAAWNNFSLAGMFVDGNGVAVSPTVGILNLAPLLSYQFDASSVTSCGLRDLDFARFDRIALRKLLEEGGAVALRPLRTLAGTGTLEVPVGGAVSQMLRLSGAASATGAASGPDVRLVLRVRGVEQPPSGDSFVRVFVNRPDADANTPITDPHYAGSFAFFADPDAHHGHGQAGSAAFLVDATAAVRRLRGLGRAGSDDEIGITLVAVRQGGGPPRQDRLRVSGLELQVVQSTAPSARPFGEETPKR